MGHVFIRLAVRKEHSTLLQGLEHDEKATEPGSGDLLITSWAEAIIKNLSN